MKSKVVLISTCLAIAMLMGLPVLASADESPAEETPAYAILYSNGEFVFQRGDVVDPAKGDVVDTWTGFETSYSQSYGDPDDGIDGELEEDASEDGEDEGAPDDGESGYGEEDDEVSAGTFADEDPDADEQDDSLADDADSYSDDESDEELDGDADDGAGDGEPDADGEEGSVDDEGGFEDDAADDGEDSSIKSMWSDYSLQVTSVVFKDVIRPYDMTGWFYGFSNLESADLTKLDMSEAVGADSLLSDCIALKSLDLGPNVHFVDDWCLPDYYLGFWLSQNTGEYYHPRQLSEGYDGLSMAGHYDFVTRDLSQEEDSLIIAAWYDDHDWLEPENVNLDVTLNGELLECWRAVDFDETSIWLDEYPDCIFECTDITDDGLTASVRLEGVGRYCGTLELSCLLEYREPAEGEGDDVDPEDPDFDSEDDAGFVTDKDPIIAPRDDVPGYGFEPESSEPIEAGSVGSEADGVDAEKGSGYYGEKEPVPSSAPDVPVNVVPSNASMPSAEPRGEVPGDAVASDGATNSSEAANPQEVAENPAPQSGAGSSRSANPHDGAIGSDPESGIGDTTPVERGLKRLDGDKALDTMAAIVAAGDFKEGGTVLLATSEGYWDALSASGAAGLADAPVLLTEPEKLSAQTRELLSTLKPAKIVACGGERALPQATVDEAAQLTGADCIRCAGATASGTAASIFAKAPEAVGGNWSSVALVCTDGGYWDALSAAPVAYACHMPIFLSEGRDAISDETITAMKAGGIKEIRIVGGTEAVGSSVAEKVVAAGFSVGERLWGETALETSVAVATFGLSQNMVADRLGIATSGGYWDALTGAALCGHSNSVLLLVDGAESKAALSFATKYAKDIANAYIFGGGEVIDAATEQAFAVACGL